MSGGGNRHPEVQIRTLLRAGILSVLCLAMGLGSAAASQSGEPSPKPETATDKKTADQPKQPAPANAAARQSDSSGSVSKTASTATEPAPTATTLTPEQARQASMTADTARLYQLAQDLKAEVDKSTKDTLSVAVIKKAAEVEELARSLKERMKSDTTKAK